MPECDHCGATFEDESSYLDHLADAHPDDLGPIERRRVDDRSGDGGLPVGPIALGGVLLVTVAVVVYVLFVVGGGGGGDGARTPHNVGAVHYHGTIEMVVDGQRVDFSRPEYQLQADAFHFENGDGVQWHVHAQGVTLGWAMDTLGITVTRDSVTYEGRTYNDSDPGTSVSVTVNDEPVTPEEYVLQKGDTVRIVVVSS